MNEKSSDDFELATDPNYLKRREFAFTTFDDTYSRGISFADAQGFRKKLLVDTRRDTSDSVPPKIHIGAVYKTEPSPTTSVTKMTADEKELVFDIDANDYDEVRFCPCKGSAQVCSICWALMENAMRIVDTSLRDDFGFEYIIWIFSGRRGVHCWVCDEKARKLSPEGRTAVASYLHMEKLPDYRSLTPARIHPMLQRAYDDVLLPYWLEMVTKRDLLMNDDAVNRLFAVIADVTKTKVDALKAKANKDEGGWDGDIPSSLQRWNWIDQNICADRPGLKQVIAFHFAYPRLDIQVSVQWGHLLKAPMTIHPSTGMICVPITTKPITSRTGFDPTAAPRIHEIQQEVDYIAQKESISAEGAVRHTSLGPYLKTLETFVAELAKDRRRSRASKVADTTF